MKKYWICIIGPVPDADLPNGADYPPRHAARQEVLAMTGHDPECSSGWCDEHDYQRIIKARNAMPQINRFTKNQ